MVSECRCVNEQEQPFGTFECGVNVLYKRIWISPSSNHVAHQKPQANGCTHTIGAVLDGFLYCHVNHIGGACVRRTKHGFTQEIQLSFSVCGCQSHPNRWHTSQANLVVYHCNARPHLQVPAEDSVYDVIKAYIPLLS
jgi:hypothetical protein